MNFCERLLEFRKSLSLNKREFSNSIGVSESYYNLIESGKREPSKNFLISLVAYSKKPEEYWLYGITEDKYKDMRDISKSTKIAFEQISKYINIEDLDILFSKSDNKSDLILRAESILIHALRSDLSYILKSKKATRD